VKVIFLADSISSQSAGIHYFGKQLVNRIIAKWPRHDYSLIATKHIEEIKIPQKIVPVDNRFPLHLRFRQLTKIPKIINRLNPDLVVELAHFGPFRLNSKIKRVTVIHDLTPILYPQFHGKMSHYLHRLLMPRIVSKADFLIVNSENTGNDLRKIFPKSNGKVFRVYPKLDLQTIMEDKAEGGVEKFFLAIGTIEPRKNYIQLIHAFETFCAINDKFSLKIAGASGWSNKEFFKAIENSPYKSKIEWLGRVSDLELQHLLLKAWAYVNVSHYEGFGLPVQESMAFGVPVILSKKSCFPEVAGNAAIYVSGEKELVEAFGSIADPANRKEYSQKSKERFNYFAKQELILPFLN